MLVFRSTLALALFALVPAALSAAEPAPSDALAARIARIENGLLPPARIAGTASEPWSVASRLVAHRVPGVSIAVIADGRIEWARGYGVARVGDPAPVSADTLFQAASISKPVAAAALLALVDAGKLSLDTDVNASLTSWKIPASPLAAGEPVTLRRLLSHTAGLTVHGFAGYAADAPRPTLLQVLDGTAPANSSQIRLALRPGTKWQYSGGGYCVAQQLLLDVSGESFAAYARTHVLMPAGMTASTYEQPLPAALAPRAAAGHRPAGDRIPGDAHVYPELAAAGLWTTPSDLARFALALAHSLAPADTPDRILKPTTAAAMIDPPLADSGYGLGIGVLGTGDALQFAHSGSNEGFRCTLVFYPRTGRGAIVMTNSDNGCALIPEILRALAREYAWPDYRIVEKTAVPLAPGAFDRFAGRYQREETLLTFSRTGPRFFLRVGTQPRRELFASSDHEFFLLNSDETFSFALSPEGELTHLIRHAPSPQIFRPVSASPRL
ncbi:MAG: serine hydrolase [Verrucomicrobia bacterium]|nr:serine hydrolase [Verrucomicrobiota bacterium]